MKTPQEVFKLMLEHWDKINHKYYEGICVKICYLYDKTIINPAEHRKAKDFLILHRQTAVEKYKASKLRRSAYWWPRNNLKIRKEFVKYLSEIKMRKTIQQKRLEFLEETVAYYSEDVNRRATNVGGSCFYLTEDGRKCAIGRHIPYVSRYSYYIEGKSVESDRVKKVLPKKILNLGTPFLSSVQELHDYNFYWGKRGLTNKGRALKYTIIDIYCTKK